MTKRYELSPRSNAADFATGSDAAGAHKALEARATSGSTVLAIEPTIHRSFP